MDATASPAPGGDDLSPAADRPPVFGLFVLMLATTAFVVLAGLGVKTLLVMRTDAEILAKTGRDAELEEIRTSSKASLGEYGAIDATTYQVPVTRAMEMVVRDPALLEPVAEPAATMPAAPAPAATMPTDAAPADAAPAATPPAGD